MSGSSTFAAGKHTQNKQTEGRPVGLPSAIPAAGVLIEFWNQQTVIIVAAPVEYIDTVGLGVYEHVEVVIE